MRSFFEPVGPDVPVWLKSILTSIRLALKDNWDHPIRLWKRATADYPTYSQAEHEGAIFYDDTLNRPVYGNSTTFITLQPYDATLAALAAYNTNGLITQTAADTFTGRTITGTAAEITVGNGDGVAGNPTLSLPAALTFTGKTVTGGTFSGPTLTGTVNVSAVTFTNACSFSGTVTFNNATGAATSVSGNRSASSWGQAGLNFRGVANTLTNTSTAEAGTVALQTASSLAQPTFASSNNITVTNATTFYIDDAPAAGSGTTIGTAWALYIGAGGARIGGALSVTGNASIGDNVADSHTVTGNLTITESSGNTLILKDSADSGSAALITLDIQGADGVSVGSFSKSSASTNNIDVTSVGGDVRILTTNALQATFDTDGLNLVSGNWYEINGTQVVKARVTGWTVASGTAQRSGYTTYTSPNISTTYVEAEVQALADGLQDVSRTLKALIDDLHGTAGHGLIGT